MSKQTSSTPDINLALQQLLDEHAILSLTARFDAAILRRDSATFRELWMEDGVCEIGQHNPGESENISPLRAEGIAAILEAQEMFNKLNEFFFRATLRSVIEISDDPATARSPNIELARRHDGHGYANVALYRRRTRAAKR